MELAHCSSPSKSDRQFLEVNDYVAGGDLLYSVCENGDYEELIQRLVVGGANVDGSCDDRRPLIVAAANGHTQCVELLLHHGAKVDVVNRRGESALLVAVRNRFMDVVEILLDGGAIPSIEVHRRLHCALMDYDVVDQLPLSSVRKLVDALPCAAMSFVELSRFAFEQAHLELAKQLLRKESDSIVKSYYSFALHSAVKNDWLDVVRHLLDRGVDIDSYWNSETALCCACRCQRSDVVELLLKRGANPYLSELRENCLLPLQIACTNGNTEIVRLLLEHNSSCVIDSTAAELMTSYHPLHVAFNNEQWDVVSQLLDFGISIDCPDSGGRTLLCIAVESGRVDRVRRLIEIGAEVRQVNSSNESLLHRSLQYANCRRSLSTEDSSDDEDDTKLRSVIRLLADKGVDSNAVDLNGETALYRACVAGLDDAVSALLHVGSHVNTMTFDGRYPLTAACEYEHADVVLILLTHGADPNVHSVGFGCVDHDSWKSHLPICVAICKGHLVIVELLLLHGATVNTIGCCGKTPLRLAIENFRFADRVHDFAAVMLKLGKIDVFHKSDGEVDAIFYFAVKNRWPRHDIDVLLKRFADKDASAYRQYALGVACLRNDEDLVNFLLLGDVNPNSVFADGFTIYGKLPLCMAAGNENPAIVDALIKNFADVNLCDKSGKAPLHYACMKDDVESVELLLEAGANPNLLTKPNNVDQHFFGDTSALPLCIAAGNGNAKIVQLLLRHLANVNARDGSGRAALHCVAKFAAGHACAHAYTRRRNSVCESDDTGSSSPLSMSRLDSDDDDDRIEKQWHCSCCQTQDSERRADALRCLLDGGADVNAVDSKGQTALYMATSRGLVKLVRILLAARGVDPNRTLSGRYPLGIACAKGYTALVEMLLVSGADPNVEAFDEIMDEIVARRPLCVAAEIRNLHMVKMLLKHGADLNATDWNGSNALLSTLDCEDSIIADDDDDDLISVIKLFLENGLDPNEPNKIKSIVPLFCLLENYALDNATSKLVRLLSEHGAKLDDSSFNIGIFRTCDAFQLYSCIVPSHVLRNFMFWLFQAAAGRKLLSLSCSDLGNFEDNDHDSFGTDNEMDTRLCRAIVLDGYRATDADITAFEQIELRALPSVAAKELVEFLFWLAEDRKNPPSLMRQCRVAVRRQLLRASGFRTVLPLVGGLPLPNHLQSYVKYEGPFCEIDLSDTG